MAAPRIRRCLLDHRGGPRELRHQLGWQPTSMSSSEARLLDHFLGHAQSDCATELRPGRPYRMNSSPYASRAPGDAHHRSVGSWASLRHPSARVSLAVTRHFVNHRTRDSPSRRCCRCAERPGGAEDRVKRSPKRCCCCGERDMCLSTGKGGLHCIVPDGTRTLTGHRPSHRLAPAIRQRLSLPAAPP